ncbi:MAG TPA: sulfate ABC transporter substrate-binding protein [Pyrinomonadaceae bacterium]|jgi:sulfate transport system substrate-binding protein|nr:sulfate ABC transporter substrate-binding protein [Pyrinomonadaceae bacterium]
MRVTVQGRVHPKVGRALAALLMAAVALAAAACLPKSQTGARRGGRQITLYGFSVTKEVMDKAVLPGFAAKWAREHDGEAVNFVTSYAGSETITNQILAGVTAQVGIFSIERDVERLSQKGLVSPKWKDSPAGGIVNKTPFVILVRRGNPKAIRDFPDLAKPGVKLIHPDPDGSGGAQWSILAIYGSELKKAEAATGGTDQARALQLLRGVWKNVLSTPDSARAARTQFETGYGDALITYELEGLMMREAGAPFEIVVPRSTVFSEHPAVVIEKNVPADDRAVVDAFMQYLWSDEAQQAFVKFHFRSVTREDFNEANKEFARVELPFTVGDLFGGWQRAYPEVIEGVWKKQVRQK